MISVQQLRELGYTEHMIRRRVSGGRLRRVHRGVYCGVHAELSYRGRWIAAVLACGPDAALSHRAAAALHDVGRVPGGPIDVTASGRHCLPGIRCHLTAGLDPDDITRVDAIPVTTVSRMLLDQAEILYPQRLRTLLEQVQRRGLLKLDQVRAMMARNTGRHGLKPLANALADLTDDAPWTQSELERAFLELIREHDLPAPQVNVLVGGELVDFYWPSHGLVVEVDGYAFHNTKRTFESDRRRDVKLALAGIRVVRFTYQRVVHEQAGLVADLRRLLSLPRVRRGA